jgi:AraC family transcriptional regulator, arabinose operon regulatory protein
MVNSLPAESAHPPFFPFSQIAPRHHIKRRGYSTWRQHGTNDWLLKHTIAGRGRIGFHGGKILVNAGDAVLFRPGTLHDYGVEDSLEYWDIVWAHFRPKPGWLELLNWAEVAPGLMRLTVTETAIARKIEIQLKEMNRLARSTSPNREAFALNALEKALLMYDDYQTNTITNTLDPRIWVVIEHMRANFKAKFSLPDLVRISQLSNSRLYHLFSAQTGQSPYEFLEFVRLDHAKHLLETTRIKIQDVATEVGFEDALNFSRRFKHRVGLSPKMYRDNISTMPESAVIDRD